MRKAAQDAKPHVKLGEEDLDNVWTFEYLGNSNRLQADGGSHLTDMKARIEDRGSRDDCRQDAKHMGIKIDTTYCGSNSGYTICSTYGCEAWELDARRARM